MARHPRLLEVPIGFAHRGASALAPGNTLEAFRLAVEMGASGLESDVWISDDGEPVLDHDGIVGGWLRRRPIATVPRARLPQHVTTLRELYAEVGSHLPISLDLKDPAAMGAVLAAADEVGARERLWICHPKPEVLIPWRERSEGAKLVVSCKLRDFRQGAERAGAELSAAGVDAVNLHHTEWTGGQVTLFHRFGLYTLGWDTQLPRHLAELLDMGIDGLFSDHTDRMMEAIAVETMGLR
jgi:glycerophosphoryl diester phosphodiesterase